LCFVRLAVWLQARQRRERSLPSVNGLLPTIVGKYRWARIAVKA
jgi:hypothetical protein